MKKINKSGFTLVELLAIIVIIAIVAVITIPQINNVIKDSKKNTTKDSAYGYKNAVHQFYLTESTENPDINMNGNYTIENGKIISGINTFDIDISGSAPESGEVTIENGEIVDGCINYGKYSVTISNGEISETTDGSCYNISYFTYDENSENNITSKIPSPNSSWTYYVKELESQNRYIYSIGEKNGDIVDNDLYTSIEECQSDINTYYKGEEEQLECKKVEKYKTYEICGIENNKTFCLKPGESNYNNNIDTLNSIFDECETQNEGFGCLGDNIQAGISGRTDIVITNYNSETCQISIIDNLQSYECRTQGENTKK